MDLKYDGGDELELIVTTEKPRSLTCSDFFFIANTEMFHAEEFFFRGTHHLKFKIQEGVSGKIDFENVGLETYLFCEDLRDELLSVITSLKSFIGGLGLHGKIPLFQPHVPEYMVEANLRFMKEAIDIDLEEREI